VADTSGIDLDQHLVLGRVEDGDGLDLNGLAVLVDDGGALGLGDDKMLVRHGWVG